MAIIVAYLDSRTPMPITSSTTARAAAVLAIASLAVLPSAVFAQATATPTAPPAPAPPATAGGPPRIDERVLQLPQTAPGSPWSFIGYGITSPSEPQWFVANGTPRGGTLGRQRGQGDTASAVIVMTGEQVEKAVDSDAALLELARARHAKIGERWTVIRHDETIARHAGTRCSRHRIEAREPEDQSPRKDSGQLNAQRLHVIGLSCVHPTDSSVLIEIGASERSSQPKMNAGIAREAEKVIASLAFQRFNEQALQKAAEAARAGQLTDAETVLKPYIDADAAWARYFMSQIIQRAQPPLDDAGARMKALLTPAAARGLPDAQWALGTLLLRGAPGVPRDPKAAEPLLRRAAERGNPGASFQLGIAMLSDQDGLQQRPQEALLWIQRAAARGQKEAQELLRTTQQQNPAGAGPAKAPVK